MIGEELSDTGRRTARTVAASDRAVRHMLASASVHTTIIKMIFKNQFHMADRYTNIRFLWDSNHSPLPLTHSTETTTHTHKHMHTDTVDTILDK